MYSRLGKHNTNTLNIKYACCVLKQRSMSINLNSRFATQNVQIFIRVFALFFLKFQQAFSFELFLINCCKMFMWNASSFTTCRRHENCEKIILKSVNYPLLENIFYLINYNLECTCIRKVEKFIDFSVFATIRWIYTFILK